MKNVTLIENSLTLHALSYLRDKTTSLVEYRFYSDQLCRLVLAETIKDLQLAKKTIETPVTQAEVQRLQVNVVAIPIFRAGIAMLPAVLSLLPDVAIGFAGMERDEATAVAREYYWHMPTITSDSLVLITDPMLATGGSSLAVLRKVKKSTPQEIRLVSVIAAPEGIEAIHKEFPEVRILTAAIDSHLNDKKYIVPGLGDYGDRYFGTEK